MKVIILGGSGTLGSEVIPLLLDDPKIERIRILARNEHRLAEVSNYWKNERIDVFVGDIRDKERMDRAIRGCAWVFHFAATKRVETSEYNPEEAVKTNVIGTMNIIDVCRSSGVEKAMFTSTDKAVAPVNVYGYTKGLAERLWIQANIGSTARFSACRYGNVLGSKGSVLDKWKRDMEENKPPTVMSDEMTRFFISKRSAAQFVVSKMYEMDGGEVFIPNMKSTTIKNLARAFYGAHKLELVEINHSQMRPGEKKHEVLFTTDEAALVTSVDGGYIRWPEYQLFPVKKRGQAGIDFQYSSLDAHEYTYQELKEMICPS